MPPTAQPPPVSVRVALAADLVEHPVEDQAVVASGGEVVREAVDSVGAEEASAVADSVDAVARVDPADGAVLAVQAKWLATVPSAIASIAAGTRSAA